MTGSRHIVRSAQAKFKLPTATFKDVFDSNRPQTRRTRVYYSAKKGRVIEFICVVFRPADWLLPGVNTSFLAVLAWTRRELNQTIGLQIHSLRRLKPGSQSARLCF